ncbi:hypothetical protein LOK49_LG08G01350 [Camellia lanceoleosa]|uniref:Uncharacterized protein n=1 Tax=Camellia lanceoleosa TaxID=1840588 RepID=A0ACC0GRL5_9ERIC|nr:hypothetical protein LOK49_LG08G01350 [Camellia lanceoleosa]
MENFRNIVNKAKKFAKPEMKSCIEEFEEKLVKFHIEKKEQELTAQNAQTHQQKLSSLENFIVAKNGEESAESDIVEDETDADVSDPSVEGMDQSSHDVSKSKVELDEHSQSFQRR